jgi:hypothetical protein
MKKIARNLMGIVAFAILAAMPEPVDATVILSDECPVAFCTLADLVGGAEVIVDGMRFHSWEFFGYAASGEPPEITEIQVHPVADDPRNPGLQYTSSAPFPIQAPQFMRFEFGYVVETTDGVARIEGSSLDLQEWIGFGEDIMIRIALCLDDFCDPFDPLADPSALATEGVTGFSGRSFASVEFAPQSRVYARTLIAIFPLSDSVSLEAFEQRWSQVPEPAINLLLTLGLAGLALFRHKANDARWTGFPPKPGRGPRC